VNGLVVYGTSLTLVIGADGTGRTPVIYPPAGSTCTATLQIPKQIDRPRTVSSIMFAVI
jgi:hypothetical protein